MTNLSPKPRSVLLAAVAVFAAATGCEQRPGSSGPGPDASSQLPGSTAALTQLATPISLEGEGKLLNDRSDVPSRVQQGQDVGALPTPTGFPWSPVLIPALGGLVDVAADETALWLATDNSLTRVSLVDGAWASLLPPRAASLEKLSGIQRSGSSLLVGVSARGQTQRIFRYKLGSGRFESVWESPLGPWAGVEDAVYFATDKPGAPLLMLGPGSSQPEAFPRPVSGSSSLFSVVAGHADSILAGTVDGALMRLEPGTKQWVPLLAGGATGGGSILGLARSTDGWYISTQWLGLLHLDASGALEVIDRDARLRFLTSSEGGPWAVEDQWLVRFNPSLGRRVRYASLEQVQFPVAVAAAVTGAVWVASASEVLLLQPDGTLATVMKMTRDDPAAPSELEIEEIIRHIASLDPPERLTAYKKLLQQQAPGYDEVFLVGLNEDDSVTLEVVTGYFRNHHPERGIEPLLDILLFIQGDREMRDHVTGILQTFGRAVIRPVASRLTEERPEVLDGGARRAMIRIMVGALDLETPEVLDHFLEHAKPEWLRLYGQAPPPSGPPPRVDEETFRILARRLRGSRDNRVIEGALRAISRLTRQRTLPPSVQHLVPAIVQHLNGSQRRWALYALTLVSDSRATRPCAELARTSPRDRFWALQALATAADPKGDFAIVEAMKDSRPEIRATAAFLVRTEMIAQGSDLLRQTLEHDPGELCSACVQALTRFRDTRSRPVLEALLSKASLTDQADILWALLPSADPAMATRLQGWLEFELLAPHRLGRLSIAHSPALDVLIPTLAVVAAHGDDDSREFISRLARTLPEPAARAAVEASVLSETLPGGLGRLLHLAVFGPSPSSLESATGSGPSLSTSAVTSVSPDTFDVLRRALFLLVPSHADPGTRAVLEDILLAAPSHRDREHAAQALFNLGALESVPTLTRALQDPYFQEGPFPFYRYPVRRLAARALGHLGVPVIRRADRSFEVGPASSRP